MKGYETPSHPNKIAGSHLRGQFSINNCSCFVDQPNKRHSLRHTFLSTQLYFFSELAAEHLLS
jgi:hypothetical protein